MRMLGGKPFKAWTQKEKSILLLCWSWIIGSWIIVLVALFLILSPEEIMGGTAVKMKELGGVEMKNMRKGCIGAFLHWHLDACTSTALH